MEPMDLPRSFSEERCGNRTPSLIVLGEDQNVERARSFTIVAKPDYVFSVCVAILVTIHTLVYHNSCIMMGRIPQHPDPESYKNR